MQNGMFSVRRILPLRTFTVRYFADSSNQGPQFQVATVNRKSIEDVLEPSKKPKGVSKVSANMSEILDLSGVPQDMIRSRRVRIYRPARDATQSGWAKTRAWKVELDNRERWENPLIGWSSTGDQLSNISMAMNFASKEDAIRYCQKYNLNYEVIEPDERRIKPKTYAENFSWDKRTRITNK